MEETASEQERNNAPLSEDEQQMLQDMQNIREAHYEKGDYRLTRAFEYVVPGKEQERTPQRVLMWDHMFGSSTTLVYDDKTKTSILIGRGDVSGVTTTELSGKDKVYLDSMYQYERERMAGAEKANNENIETNKEVTPEISEIEEETDVEVDFPRNENDSIDEMER
jgi:hypothetical protein